MGLFRRDVRGVIRMGGGKGVGGGWWARGSWSVSRGAWSGEIGKHNNYRTFRRARERGSRGRESESVCV